MKQGLHILVVEDNATLARNLVDYLEQHGHRVDYARDGALATQLALDNRYDVIVLDLMLPHFSVSGRLITGQNPFSTALVAEAVVQALGKRPIARVPDPEERTTALLSRVVKGDLDWAKGELAQRSAMYQIPLIGGWGYYASMAAVERKDIQRAATVMELATPYVRQPKFQLALAKAYVRLGQNERARALLTQLAKEQPDMQEARELLSKLKG